jgi:hypothetical protein
MALGTQRSSTVDSSAGALVAIASNADGSSGVIQASAPVALKETYSETSRTALTAADAPTGGNMTTGGFGSSGLVDVGQALQAQVRASCGTASAVLTGRLAFYDESSACIGMSETVTLTADGTLRLGNASGDFVTQTYLVDLRGATQVKFKVDSVSAGTWAVYVRGC